MNDRLSSMISVGDWVRCERTAPAKGSWRKYAGKVGRVISHNRSAKEWGVRFTASHNDPVTWFLKSELVVAKRPRNAPEIGITDATAPVERRNPVDQAIGAG